MYSALRRAFISSKEIASAGIVLDAKNEVLANYYESYGFLRLQDTPDSIRMFLPMKDLATRFQ